MSATDNNPVSQLAFGDLSKLGAMPIPGVIPQQSQSDTFWSSNPVFGYVNRVYSDIATHRKNLNLENPGTVENLSKEVTRDVFVNQYFFTGLRADLNKVFNMNPAFQTSHTLSIGSQSLPPYAFTAFYANDQLFAQGNVDNDLSLSGRFNYGWDKNNISKVTLQLANGQPAMVQLEQDFQSDDFSINVKTLNPSLFNGFSGVAVGSLLQSITPRLAVGLETIYQQQPGAPGEAAISYFGRYNAGNWIATAQFQGQGALNTTFWRKVSLNVEAGLESNLAISYKPIMDSVMGQPIGIEPVFEGSTTIGAKYEYRQSVFRGQVDTAGKVSCFLERKLLPTLSILFSGEIDQIKSTSRLGLGIQVESAGNEQLMLMQQGLVDANGNPVPGAPEL
ncbi:hypothetical protein BABINDRAFT_179033 [Babjeviella inositovora NRRL Y-12698]|uniref:Translocase of outer membrane 40 kDa subunit n=1 Tax=Babjeviella inositovora NRRL Y-12698 TaxID=984486 RepID=A0A1E3QZD7_9ASCO|nr:uncharacterized protein BABINDRAFT_179033 [Babjeviella inositovora NRRL Y-12698]ODQ82998.1 hypothetical protein BABINDRAFT_179033 [Babjeviella inositovora NRRL Y-12698]